MAVNLDEDMVGRDDVVIGFPCLRVCMGFVARTANDLWGVHLTNSNVSVATLTEFWNWSQAKGLVVGQITDLYGSADHKIRYGAAGNAGINAWTNEMQIFANILGYHGPAHGFDTSIIDPRDGTFVEYHRQIGGNYPCQIFYKRDEKTHETGSQLVPYNGGASDVAWVRPAGGFRPSTNMKTGIVGNRSVFHSGQMHEVDYALRLITIQV